MHLTIPEHYDAKLSPRETQEAIRFIRETFQDEFGQHLNLTRVSAPMMVDRATGLNDNLNGVEAPVSFTMADMPGHTMEIVHSLAKWKRNALGELHFKPGEGLYTNMNAIRKDETLDNLHSIYVDQWDWEKVLTKEARTLDTLKTTVQQIFKVIKHMEHEVWYQFPQAVHHLPDDIHFITTQELEDRWPTATPMQREDLIAKELGCVFIMQIGGTLKSGAKHDGRAPDYDDWHLNGDIVFWYPPLDQKLEISSMGIRVDETAMRTQLELAGAEDRLKLPFHRKVVTHALPYTIGGGIGQSRLCMLLLGKAHVGEVQSSIWPQAMRAQCAAAGIQLL